MPARPSKTVKNTVVSSCVPVHVPQSGNILVIVESPAKCKKIETYLGPGFKCIASYGHFREIENGLKSITFHKNNACHSNKEQDNIQIKYVFMKSKEENISRMRQEISVASEVVLATDDDREGEAIAWHICDAFGLSVSTTKRIVFHEITEQALKSAILSPRYVDMNLVKAQHARQVLDVIVGYSVSPVLWEYIARNMEAGLSAGRCQTPAVRLVYDNAKEVDASPGNPVYVTTAYFTRLTLPFVLNHEFDNSHRMSMFLEETSKNAVYTLKRGEVKKVTKKAPTPFTTSTLQQAANNECRFSPKETMEIAQTLYESGYITYMRTDSKTYCREFIDSVAKYVISKWNNPEYVATIPVVENTEAASLAHEAIRPTDISRESIPMTCHPREHRLYNMIWRNSVESCMADAKCETVITTMCINNVTGFDTSSLEYRYTAERIVMPGWKVVSGTSSMPSESEFAYLTSIKEGTIFPYIKIMSKVSMRNTKSHYTEAGLVQILEKRGIGRPSTFSSLIDKIQSRNYVKKRDIIGKTIMCVEYEVTPEKGITSLDVSREVGNESSKLVIEPVGIMVTEFLVSNFAALFDYDYTKRMEDALDKVAAGAMVWTDVCYECRDMIHNQIEELKKIGIIKEPYKIDEHHTYIIGKYGPVIKYTKQVDGNQVVQFKGVRSNIDYNKMRRGEYTLDELLDPFTNVHEYDYDTSDNGNTRDDTYLIDDEETQSNKGTGVLLGKYRGKDLILKKGKYGLYAVLGEETISLKGIMASNGTYNKRSVTVGKDEKQRSIRSEEDLTYDNVVRWIETTRGVTNDEDTTRATSTSIPSGIIREIDENSSIRNGRYGHYIMYKKPKMVKPKFITLSGFNGGDYNTCDIDILKAWITKHVS
jgi:DNA topoisomerase-1